MGQQYSHLSAEERGAIMVLIAQGASGRQIAQTLGRAQSTIARELRRNGYRSDLAAPLRGRPRLEPDYDATRAGRRAQRLRRRARVRRKLRRDTVLWRRVRYWLERCWSPQQIADKLRDLYPDRPWLRVSHETIYTAIYAMPRGELRRQVTRLLRQGRKSGRRTRQGSDARGHLPDLPNIRLRPPAAHERLMPGHWEGDLIVGAHNRSAIGVLVCRRTLYVKLVKLADATAHTVLEAFSSAFEGVPESLKKTLTYDQGKEMASHRQLSERTGLAIYFADPHSPWQRGTCENTNGLLRQYFPKGTDLSVHSAQRLKEVAWEMNNRPRRSLGRRSPVEVLYEELKNPRAQGDALGH
ncbi:integrase core domain [Lysobacter enzymogenes]|uniref:ISMsm8, transposase n=1 Tax=Lysobacter enzymogenes TaxID=69 RepID=A0A0S2DIZ1_LYSEN|nr:IS30 family transposase [Lysobacter enzymogenes]ALN58494.1 ISMsm8, transposase [Lysobacter enzymogenes]ALN59316.1 integrase core domain [Lysobacter enzymogenes]QCW27496.1 IS30 family transposase [Lysobacter enzymogenes]QCW28218.1 IS30 family transposase [Lysobacter enzymogenes]